MAVIFGPDAFTVGANTNIDAYPSGDPDYAYSRGSGGNMIVSGANDRVESVNSTSDIVARCTQAGSLGDQEVRATLGVTLSGAGAGLGVRYSTTTRGMTGLIDTVSANEIQLWEDNAGYTLRASSTGSFGTTGTWDCALRATGPVNDVDFSFTVAAVSPLTYTDTSFPATGYTALYTYAATAGSWIDDFEVDDLTAGAATTLPLRNNSIHRLISAGF